MRKKKKINLFLPILFVVSLAFISINTSHLYLFLSRERTCEDSTISVIDTPKLSWGIEWVIDGKPICTESSQQSESQICSDGNGGAIITWQDFRSGLNYDIYAQLISSSGVIQWMVDGIAICTASSKQEFPQICSDGDGGAIITWKDFRSGPNPDIYAQRINSNGAVQWDADGVAICTASDYQSDPQICSDGDEGAIITWEDHRGADYDIYTQRVNSNGVVQWTSNGVAICTAIHNQWDTQICSSGSGGAIITWEDDRDTDDDIYAQRVNPNGVVTWTADGVEVCTASNTQFNPQICSDGVAGGIITWHDFRGADRDIYSQRVNSIGIVQWTPNGVVICTASNNQLNPQICSDGGGGAIITWEDYRSSAGYDIYAQLINSNGAVQWTGNGLAICTASYSQNWPRVCSDGGGGVIITWQDFRNGVDTDIYVQRVNSNGVVQWTVNGLAICTADESQNAPQICSDEYGGSIITWKDDRSMNEDIYAQRIKNSVPTSNHPEDITTSISGSETINWTLNDDSGGDQYRVLVNNTNGNFYIWVDWTPWIHNTPFSVLINRTTTGVYDYTIEYYDDQRTYGVSDTVLVTIEDEGTSISFGFYFVPFSFIGLIFIIIRWRQKINHK